jgi:hypothetical protein
MMPRMIARFWLVSWLPALACVPVKPLVPGQACPCAPGWTCDEAQRLCFNADGSASGPPDAAADSVELPVPADAPEPADAPVPADAPEPTCGQVTYPERGFYAPNALLPGATTFTSTPLGVTAPYELIAQLAPGTTLTIKMTLLGDAHDAGAIGNVWWLNQGQGWLVSLLDENSGEQTFFSSVLRPELEIAFSGHGRGRVDYYECGSTVPTRTKMINW